MAYIGQIIGHKARWEEDGKRYMEKRIPVIALQRRGRGCDEECQDLSGNISRILSVPVCLLFLRGPCIPDIADGRLLYPAAAAGRHPGADP